MKKSLLFLFLVTILGISCTKRTVYPTPGTGEFSYVVNGITSVTVNKGFGPAFLNLSVELVSGVQENVNVSIVGLPAGVTDTIFNQHGIPTFNTFIQFSATNSALNGTYPVTLRTSTDGGVTKDFRFYLTVGGSCASTLADFYLGSDACSGGSFSTQVFAVASVPNRINIANFAGAGINVFADIDCPSSTLIIPSQTDPTSGATIQGFGSFTSTSISYSYTVSFSGSTINCSCTLTR